VEALVDTLEMARYEGAQKISSAPAFLEAIGREVSAEIQRTLAAGWPS